MAEAVAVVPSGKVYRQMFEAQVDLSREVYNVKARLQESDEHLPGGEGLARQRANNWLNTEPYEYRVENPVLYKLHNAADLNANNRKTKELMREVQSLPDVVLPAKLGSDIICRVQLSRQEQHQATLDNMYCRLEVVAVDAETQLKDIVEDLFSSLVQHEKEILAQMGQVEPIITQMESLDELRDLWGRVHDQLRHRLDLISTIGEKLEEVERQRRQKLVDIFSECGDKLRQVALLQPHNLQTFLDTECQSINKVLLSNQRQYGELVLQLRLRELAADRSRHSQFDRATVSWREERIRQAINEFEVFMASEEVRRPTAVQLVVDEILQVQQQHKVERLRLLTSLREMAPPLAKKSAVQQAGRQLVAFNKTVDEANQSHIQKLGDAHETIVQTCLEFADGLGQRLVRNKVMTPRESSEMIRQHMLPEVGEYQRSLEEHINQFDLSVERQNARIELASKKLIQYIQGAVHWWDQHEFRLSREERRLQEQLQNQRHSHDASNKKLELKLDRLLDKLRQSGSNNSLQTNLASSLKQLTAIRDNFVRFYQEQQSQVGGYPERVADTVEKYEANLTRYFEVDRNHPEDHRPTKDVSDDETETARSVKSDGASLAKKKSKKKVEPEVDPIDEQLAELDFSQFVVDELLKTEQGTTFYCLKKAEPPVEDCDPLFESIDELAELPEYCTVTEVDSSVFTTVRKEVLQNFLTHLDGWWKESAERSKQVVTTRSQELESERELREHLHEPRAARIQGDIAGVRSEELLLHSDRLERHCRGLFHKLSQLQKDFIEMRHTHERWLEEVTSEMNELIGQLPSAQRSTTAARLRELAQLQQNKFMSNVRQSLRDMRQHIDSTADSLRASNAAFLTSFKLFLDGGNFCAEEINEFKDRLDELARHVDTVESESLGEMESMEAQRLRQMHSLLEEFDSRSKYHLVDLLFMEKVSRWLTNTQCKIKAEVEDSNRQAQHLASLVVQLDKRIDSIKSPNVDKESITAVEVTNSLDILFEACNARLIYLDAAPVPDPPAIVESDAKMSRKQSRKDAVPEDTTVTAIQQLLKVTTRENRPVPEEPVKDGKKKKEELKSDESTEDKYTSHSKPPKKGGLASTEAGTSDGGEEGPKKSRKKKDGEKKRRTLSAGLLGNSRAARQALEVLYLQFGRAGVDEDPLNLLGKIRTILRTANEALLQAGELFYRARGSRQLTRPAVHETFEEFSRTVCAKLSSYWQQADDYQNQSLQEMREQLVMVELLTRLLPDLLFQEELSARSASYPDMAGVAAVNREHQKLKEENEGELRPVLGHPEAADQLAAVVSREEERQRVFRELVQRHFEDARQRARVAAQEFLERLDGLAADQLQLYDSLLTVDESARGRRLQALLPTVDLLRRRLANLPLEDPEKEKPLIERGSRTWEPLAAVSKLPQLECLPAVTTQKTTLAHKATVDTREQIFQNYTAGLLETLSRLNAEEAALLEADSRWSTHWAASVQHIRDIF